MQMNPLLVAQRLMQMGYPMHQLPPAQQAQLRQYFAQLRPPPSANTATQSPTPSVPQVSAGSSPAATPSLVPSPTAARNVPSPQQLAAAMAATNNNNNTNLSAALLAAQQQQFQRLQLQHLLQMQQAAAQQQQQQQQQQQAVPQQQQQQHPSSSDNTQSQE